MKITFLLLFGFINSLFASPQINPVKCTWFADYALYDSTAKTGRYSTDWAQIEVKYDKGGQIFYSEVPLLNGEYKALIKLMKVESSFTSYDLIVDLFKYENKSKLFAGRALLRGKSEQEANISIYTPEVGKLAANEHMTPDEWLHREIYPEENLLGKFQLYCAPFNY